MDSPKDTKNNHLGITFDEIHSDEPHEAVSAQSTEADKSHTPAKSHLSGQGSVFNVANAFDEDSVEEGTIVSDKRTRRHSFGESLKDAWTEWLGDAKEKISEISDKVETIQETSAPTVASVETRKEVVEKAAMYATIAPKDDTKIVVEKIRTYKKDVAEVTGQPLRIKEPTPSTPSWKHTDDAPVENTAPTPAQKFTAPDMRASMVAPVIAQKIKKGIDEYTAKTKSPLPQSTPSTHVPSPRVYLGTKPDARKNPLSVAPIVAGVSGNVKKDLEAFSTPTPTISATSIASHVVRPTQTEWKQEVPPVVAPVHQDIPETVPRIVVEPIPAFESIHVPAPETEIPVPLTPEVPQTPVYPSEDATPLDVAPEFRSAPLPDFVKQEMVERTEQNQNLVSRQSASQPQTLRTTFDIRLFVRVGAVCAIVVFGVGLAVFMKSQTGGEASVTGIVDPSVLMVSSLIPVDTQSPIALTGTPSAFRETVHTAIQGETSSITHFYPTISDGTYVRIATSKEIFGYLNAHMPQSMIQALDDNMMFGSIMTSKNEPFVLIRSQSFDTLFTGMLAWEQYLFADFGPLFGTTPPESLLFKDAVRNNASTRILYDQSGNEILLYSFVGKNTVIITSSGEALSALVSRF
jgi:hypothetical protein